MYINIFVLVLTSNQNLFDQVSIFRNTLLPGSSYNPLNITGIQTIQATAVCNYG